MKTENELDFFKQFLHSNYIILAKIHFPLLIYPELPKQPGNMNWQEQQQFIIDNLISDTFRQEFEARYANNIEGRQFEIIVRHKAGDINETKRHEMVNHFLDSQPKLFVNSRDLAQTDYKLGDFNVYKQLLDNTPDNILRLTLNSICAEFPDAQVTWLKLDGRSFKFNLNEVFKILADIGPLSYLDSFYDDNGNWQLHQPEENSFLLIGTNSINLIERLKQGELEIEVLENQAQSDR